MFLITQITLFLFTLFPNNAIKNIIPITTAILPEIETSKNTAR